MMENQQLIKKDRSANSYSKIFPWTFTDLVLDRVTKESLDNILVRNNFMALPYVDSKAATRLQVPMKNRRRGIWLSYIDYAGTLTVEYYNDNNLDDNHWQDSSYWLPYNTAEFQSASVGLSALAQEVFDWINSQITAAVKLNPEDLQKNSSGQIEEANRAYDTSTFSGLGYRILRKNIQNNKNILTQSMINMPNNVYQIRYDFDLNGATINLPANSVLQFVGGSIKNGTIIGQNTKIRTDKIAFKSNIKLKGSFIGDVRTSWFEIDSTDCTDTLDSIFNVFKGYNIIIDEGIYNISTKNLPREDIPTQYSIFILNSNTNVILNGTIKLLSNDLTNYQIFRLYNIDNVIISGNGSIVGDVETHTGTTGEWGHGISISSSRHITVKDISISKCWGDGITIASYSEDNLSKDITIDNIVSTYNRRLGVSLISGDGIKFINSTTEGNGTINGTAPKMGLDIEPNPNETLNHILVDNCLIKDKGTCYIPSTASIEDIDYKIIIQNCNIPSQFNISGPCTFKGNRVRFAYISNVRYAEIQDNHIYENLIFAGNDSTPITNTKVVGNNITPLNNAAHNAAIVFDGSAVTLDKVTFVNNTIDLTKKSNIALQRGAPVNGRLNIENCVILGNKAEQQVYWTAGNIINSLIDTECINIFNANSVEGSEVNFIGNTIIYYRENPFVIRDNITVNYNINIINNNIIPIGYTATDLINYVSHTFAGTIKSLGNNFLGKDPSTVGTYANKPTLTGSQIGRIYYMTDNSIPAFWNGEAWRDANGYPALKKKGTTAERPAIPSGNYSGYTYYDTTLNKYILWNGTAWTNVDGTNLT